MQTEVFITSEYITLGQFLKFENIIESGGNVKFFLEEIPVYINNERDNRRGRKLYPGDVIVIDEVGEFVIVAE
ncbi:MULTISPECIES: S4 domain-containing protein YaaA [Bacteria]|jgi:S4 domain protein yaaA|uniref:S4 domain-containing protein YaaA n=2 Tax=Turicibacter sanguinis TaxID=154288 RepID=A0A173RX93_9FIRM|nr:MULTISPECIES: S4 domain-containing protein YaaA [Bacteria]RXD25233.1 S4 domain-containing protein YaaA [Acinetobacter baumannii]EFF63047.1 S4 domain protein YaaA [Turicibacter sanguinis PC909]EGC92899.1 S4 domain protein YaaA [Turicibacter sp. HGF1]KAB6101358.1 S4 domain-containing protein YaaA [Bacteroides xylanisolvens]MBP3904881.1 S4 domain-containing protein YaaA [Turicibacter sp.]